MLISIYNDYTTINNIYYKAYLIKVIEVLILDYIFCIYISY
jgi:hypothetical protein